MKRKLRFILAALVALLVCFALVACGDDGDTGNNDGVTTLAIGFGGPITQGDVAFGTGARDAVLLAVAQANESDRAQELGVQFRVVEGDDQSRADRGVAAANTLVSERDLVGVVGHFNSAVSIPASQVYNDNDVVQISYGSTNPDLTAQGFRNVFRTCATDALQGPMGAQAAIDLGFTNVFIVDDSSIYGQGLTAEFSRQFEALGGTIVGTESTQQGQNDFSPVVTRIQATDADLIYFGGTYSADTGAGSLFSRQLTDGGVSAPVMGGDGIQNDAFIVEAGEAANGDMATKPGAPIADLPKGADFIAAYTDMFSGRTPGGFDAFAFDAANAIINAVFEVIEEGMDADDVASGNGRRAVIDAVAGISFEGVTGTVSFNDYGDSNNPTITTYLVENGEWIAHPDLKDEE